MRTEQINELADSIALDCRQPQQDTVPQYFDLYDAFDTIEADIEKLRTMHHIAVQQDREFTHEEKLRIKEICKDIMREQHNVKQISRGRA